jgi:cysteine sulfinate desulfinase/cysteine desulfurase-like protein
MTSVYDSERLAAAYASDRPAVHGQILGAARLGRQARQALDEARDWCRETLQAVFADGEVTVVIPGYVATLASSGPGL